MVYCKKCHPFPCSCSESSFVDNWKNDDSAAKILESIKEKGLELYATLDIPEVPELSTFDEKIISEAEDRDRRLRDERRFLERPIFKPIGMDMAQWLMKPTSPSSIKF